jgi:hypothetical protein
VRPVSERRKQFAAERHLEKQAVSFCNGITIVRGRGER